MPTSILTDASSLNGLGYVLVQHEPDGKYRLIQAGSRSMTDTEKRYAPIEQECLAAVWSIDKCRHFLFGCPTFRLVTDHQPLLGTFQKDLVELQNRRLQRLREKVTDYSFTVDWVEGMGIGIKLLIVAIIAVAVGYWCLKEKCKICTKRFTPVQRVAGDLENAIELQPCGRFHQEAPRHAGAFE